MRVITDTRILELYNRGLLQPIPLIKLTTYTDRVAKTGAADHYFSNRALQYDYDDTGTVRNFEPFLDTVEEFTKSIPHMASADSAARALESDLSILMRNHSRDGTTTTLYESLSDENLLGADVELSELLINTTTDDPNDASGFAGDDHIVVYKGSIISVRGIGETFVINVGRVEAKSKRLTLNNKLENAHEDFGSTANTIYGTAKKVRLQAVSVPGQTTLSREIDEIDTILYLTDISQVQRHAIDPTNSSGLVKLGIETIYFASRDGDTLIGCVRGYHQTDAVSHSVGAIVYYLSDSLKLLVAGHPVHSIGNLYIKSPLDDTMILVDPDIIAYTTQASISSVYAGFSQDDEDVSGTHVAMVTISTSVVEELLQQFEAFGEPGVGTASYVEYEEYAFDTANIVQASETDEWYPDHLLDDERSFTFWDAINYQNAGKCSMSFAGGNYTFTRTTSAADIDCLVLRNVDGFPVSPNVYSWELLIEAGCKRVYGNRYHYDENAPGNGVISTANDYTFREQNPRLYVSYHSIPKEQDFYTLEDTGVGGRFDGIISPSDIFGPDRPGDYLTLPRSNEANRLVHISLEGYNPNNWRCTDTTYWAGFHVIVHMHEWFGGPPLVTGYGTTSPAFRLDLSKCRMRFGFPVTSVWTTPPVRNPVSAARFSAVQTRFYADVEGMQPPYGDTTYSDTSAVGADNLIQPALANAPDIIRHIIQERYTDGASVDEASWAIAEAEFAAREFVACDASLIFHQAAGGAPGHIDKGPSDTAITKAGSHPADGLQLVGDDIGSDKSGMLFRVSSSPGNSDKVRRWRATLKLRDAVGAGSNPYQGLMVEVRVYWPTTVNKFSDGVYDHLTLKQAELRALYATPRLIRGSWWETVETTLYHSDWVEVPDTASAATVNDFEMTSPASLNAPHVLVYFIETSGDNAAMSGEVLEADVQFQCQTSGSVGFVEQELGENIPDIIGRIAFDSRSQVVRIDNTTDRFRWLSADSSYEFPTTSFTITEWEKAEENARDLRTVYTDWRASFDRDRPALDRAGIATVGEYLQSTQISADISDSDSVTVADVQAQESKTGHLQHPGLYFPTLTDPASAIDSLGFYTSESLRSDARRVRFIGVPWSQAFLAELGDTFDAQLESWTASRKMRLISLTKRYSDGLFDLVGVEVG